MGEAETSENDERKVAPIADPGLYKIKHPLQHKWTLWYDNPNRKATQQSWSRFLKKVTEFDYVEDFWAVYSNIVPASKLPPGSNYHLFKSGVQPMWEDPMNEHGGKWVVTLSRNARDEKLDFHWLATVLSMIGETFEDDGEVMGAVVSVRRAQDKLAVWTRWSSEEHEDSIRKIGQRFKAVCKFDCLLGFQAHEDYSSFKNNVRYEIPGNPDSVFGVPDGEQRPPPTPADVLPERDGERRERFPYERAQSYAGERAKDERGWGGGGGGSRYRDGDDNYYGDDRDSGRRDSGYRQDYPPRERDSRDSLRERDRDWDRERGDRDRDRDRERDRGRERDRDGDYPPSSYGRQQHDGPPRSREYPMSRDRAWDSRDRDSGPSGPTPVSRQVSMPASVVEKRGLLSNQGFTTPSRPSATSGTSSSGGGIGSSSQGSVGMGALLRSGTTPQRDGAMSGMAPLPRHNVPASRTGSMATGQGGSSGGSVGVLFSASRQGSMASGGSANASRESSVSSASATRAGQTGSVTSLGRQMSQPANAGAPYSAGRLSSVPVQAPAPPAPVSSTSSSQTGSSTTGMAPLSSSSRGWESRKTEQSSAAESTSAGGALSSGSSSSLGTALSRGWGPPRRDPSTATSPSSSAGGTQASSPAPPQPQSLRSVSLTRELINSLRPSGAAHGGSSADSK